ncbi:MAG: hypothetical protein LLG97_11400 [Deltaproteobacteria bacterium]|nr:hypothetical protein [Deltaproteobacteria bacterium]
MKKAIVSGISIVCCFAALFLIKMMNLPGLITVLLVIADVLLLIFLIIYMMGGKKIEAQK